MADGGGGGGKVRVERRGFAFDATRMIVIEDRQRRHFSLRL